LGRPDQQTRQLDSADASAAARAAAAETNDWLMITLSDSLALWRLADDGSWIDLGSQAAFDDWTRDGPAP